MTRALIAAGLVLVALTGCTSGDGGIADAANAGDTNYVSVDQSSHFYAEGDRSDPVDFTTETSTGDAVSTDDLRGKVVVLNFWYASCPPCRTEAPTLDAVYQQYPADQVVFLGVNVRDDAATIASFEKTFDVPYPSTLDADTGDVQLAFAETVPANATPATLVLDTQGRVAARMLGELESASQLGGFVDAVLEEG